MTVSVTREGAVLTLRLDRPEKKNALTQAMYRALSEGLRTAEADPEVRVVLLAGGMDFTAGNDIADFAARKEEGPSEAFHFLETLVGFAKPVVAAVRGHAVGIGTTLLLHCDVVVASEAARLMMPFTKLGLVPEAGSSMLLARRVGAARARWWLLSGTPISGHEAAEAGLVTRAVPDDAVEEEARAVAQLLAALPPGSMAETKRLVLAAEKEALETAMRAERESFGRMLRGEEAQAIFREFLNRSG
ncbi:enoyl-CoA hydratase-related protein [Sabulicella rubraurantiaca]|uniref:enoyl-CoA hydratase-related protein n=1 Tax=Sabulicella rubraurantiaca TaxID=2811429 RepID=UPI001A96D389|nr:enoyl-CoA hydratase-related protein [Sabulicella rubraurantiaca]